LRSKLIESLKKTTYLSLKTALKRDKPALFFSKIMAFASEIFRPLLKFSIASSQHILKQSRVDHPISKKQPPQNLIYFIEQRPKESALTALS
jgi:hypothetical protein